MSSPRSSSSEGDCVYWNTSILSHYRQQPNMIASSSKLIESTPIKRKGINVFPSPSSISAEEGQVKPLRKLKKNRSVLRLDVGSTSQIGEDTLKAMSMLAERLKRNEETRDLLQAGTRTRSVHKTPKKKVVPSQPVSRSVLKTLPISKPIPKPITKPITPPIQVPSPLSKGKSRIIESVLVPDPKKVLEEEKYFDDDDDFEFALCSQLQVMEESFSSFPDLVPVSRLVEPKKSKPSSPKTKIIPQKSILPPMKPVIKSVPKPTTKLNQWVASKPVQKMISKSPVGKSKMVITQEQQAEIAALTAGIDMDDWSDDDI